MFKNVSFSIVPSSSGGAHMAVYVQCYPNGVQGKPKSDGQLYYNFDFDMDVQENATRAWINRAIRIMARQLEEEWYEMAKHTPAKLTKWPPTR